MKILHFAPTLQSGEASQLAADLAYALQVFDVQSHLVAPGKALAGVPASSQLRNVPYSPALLPGAWGHIMKLRSLINERKPDIVQAYGYEAIVTAARACRLLSASKRPKLVGALIGYPPHAEALQAPELRACAAITVISKHLRHHLKKMNSAFVSSWVIPYGVNEILCYPTYRSAEEWRSQWQSERADLRERFVVCVPGPISAYHGTADIVPIAVTLLQQDIPVQMLVTGSVKQADPAFMTLLRRRARSSGIEARISWVENPAQLRDIMCASHAVLNLASMPEAYNRPMLEALALGRPVAGYGHGIAEEYLEAFQPVGIVPVGNYDAIADVLSQWHTYPPDAVERIPYPYRLSDTAKSYYDLYSSLT